MARIDVNKIGISRFIDNTVIFKRKLSIRRDNDGNLAEAAHILAQTLMYSGRKVLTTLLWIDVVNCLGAGRQLLTLIASRIF